MFAIPSVFCFLWAFENGIYPQIAPLFVSAFFCLCSLFNLFYLFFSGITKLYEDRLVRYSFFGLPIVRICLSDITNVEVIEYTDAKFEELVVYANRKKIKVNTHSSEEYTVIKEYILSRGIDGTRTTIRKDDGNVSQSRLVDRINATFNVLGLFLGFLFLWFSGRDYFYPNHEFKNMTLSTVPGILAEDPIVHKTRSHSVRFKLKRYPDLIFEIYRYYNCADIYGIESNMKRGDSVYITINSDQFNKHINRQMPLSFTDKYVNYGVIQVYGLSDTAYMYLDTDIRKPINEQGSLAWFLLIGGIGLALVSYNLYELYKMYK